LVKNTKIVHSAQEIFNFNVLIIEKLRVGLGSGSKKNTEKEA